LSVLALIVATGCYAPDRSNRLPVVQAHDSAGVRLLDLEWDIAEFASPRLALKRQFVVGEREGTELYRVRGASFLDSGELVIANGGVPEVVVVRDGAVVSRFGTRGEGPGEFGVISSVHTLPGRIVTYDHAQGRLTEFGPSGELRGTRRMTEPNRVADLRPLTLSADGTALAVYTDQRFFRPGEIVTDTTPLLRYRLGDPVPDTLSWWQVRTWSFASSGMGATRAQVPYSPTLLLSGGRTRFALANSHEAVITVFDDHGERITRVRWESESRPVSRDDVSRWNEERWSELPDGFPADVRRGLIEIEPHTVHPVINGIHVGDSGDVWFAPASLGGSRWQTWITVGPEGDPRGGVRLPESATVLATRDGRVAVLAEDAYGVEIVTVYLLSG
jgi:hypothetical protein